MGVQKTPGTVCMCPAGDLPRSIRCRGDAGVGCIAMAITDEMIDGYMVLGETHFQFPKLISNGRQISASFACVASGLRPKSSRRPEYSLMAAWR
jgi:hypothetical protein